MTDIDLVRLNFNPQTLFLLNCVLGFVMFGVSLELKAADFRAALQTPRALRASDVALLEASPNGYKEVGHFTPANLPEKRTGNAWQYPAARQKFFAAIAQLGDIRLGEAVERFEQRIMAQIGKGFEDNLAVGLARIRVARLG